MAEYIIDSVRAPIDFECRNDIERRIAQNAKNLLCTRMGEIPFDRLRGVNPALFDLPYLQMQASLMPEIDRVLAWEPECEATEAHIDMDRQGNAIIVVTVSVNG